MADKKTLVRKGLGAVFGGLDKEQQPTVEPADTEAKEPPEQSIPSQEMSAKPENADRTPTRAEGITTPETPPTPLRSTEQTKPPRGTDETNDPYAHVRRVTWPLLNHLEPYIIPGPEGFDNLNGTINCRLPANMDATIDAHCRSVGAKKSAWIREALRRLLAEEQKVLKKIQSQE